MTRAKEAAIWRKMGRGFEMTADTGQYRGPYRLGICFNSFRHGLPSYSDYDARVRYTDSHGCFGYDSSASRFERRFAAHHRAMTCYLMAEMVKDGCAPGEGP